MKHVVGFSGGIDSQACARWVLNRFPQEDVILLNSDAGGNEHPLTTEFIEWYSANVHPVVMLSPQVIDMAGRAPEAIEAKCLKPDDPLTFGLLAELKGYFPVKNQQFCTQHLKLEPQKRWMAANLADNYWRYSGVRREEGKPREDGKGRFYTPFESWDAFFNCDQYNPLADWTKQMCFEYCRYHGEKVNPLYALGFEKVGCSPCVSSRKEDIRNWATRFPEMIDKVRDWEDQAGAPFFRPDEAGGRILWIDEIVEWSRTVDRSRSIVKGGGRQLSILADVAEPCSSKYGLCE